MRIRSSLPVLLLLILGLGLPCLAPAATLVVANKAEATVSLLDLKSGAVVATLPTGEGPHEVAISPDGRQALITNYGRREAEGSSLTLVDLLKAEVVKTIALGDYRRPHGVLFADAGRAWVTVEADQALIEVDLEKGAVISSIETGQEISHMVAVDGEGRRAFIANIGSGSVTVLDLEKGTRLKNIETGDGAEGVAVIGGQAWITNRGADTVTVLDARSLEIIATFESAGFPIRAAATSRGQVLVTRAQAGDLVIYDAKSRAALREVDFDLSSLGAEDRLFADRFGDSSVPIGVVSNAAGTLAYVAHANADVITEVDLEKGRVTRTLRAGKEPDGMGWSPLDVLQSR